MAISDKGKEIMKAMAKNGTAFQSPSKIGEACGKSYYNSSSWTCSGLQPLAKAGLVSRNVKGHWALTPAGLEIAATL